MLSAPLASGTLDLSGIPLTARDMERLCAHLQRHAATVVSLELGFTELTDEAFLLLLPTLAALPHLETLTLNGNRLTRAVLKDLTDALKVRHPFRQHPRMQILSTRMLGLLLSSTWRIS